MPGVYSTTKPKWLFQMPLPRTQRQIIDTTSSSRGQHQRVIGASHRNNFLKFLTAYLDTPRLPHSVSSTLNELEKLRQLEDDTEDEYVFRPTPRASGRIQRYINVVYEKMLNHFPKPKMELDGAGGMILDWRGKDNGKIIRLACRASANQRDYIYYQSPTEHPRAIDASATALLERLEWLKTVE